MYSLPTVKVERPGSKKGYHLINEKDFDPKKHTLWVEPKKPEPTATEAKAVEVAAQAVAAKVVDELEAAKAEAKALGINVGKKWTLAQIQAAIAEAKAGDGQADKK